MSFVYNSSVAFYLKSGWKLVSPARITCPLCKSALIENVLHEFLFCVPCQKQLVLNENKKLVVLEKEQLQQSTNSYVEQQPTIISNDPIIESQQMDDNEEDTEDITSKLLLSGWKMTNMYCPTNHCCSPLMQKPRSNQLLCGKCRYESTTEETGASSVELTVNPSDLARQIAQNADKRMKERFDDEEEPQIEYQKPQIQQQQRIETSSRVQQLCFDLTEKILRTAEVLLEPCTVEEVADYSGTIKHLKEVLDILNALK